MWVGLCLFCTVCCYARSVGQCCPGKHDSAVTVQWRWSSRADWVSRIHSRGLSLAGDRDRCAFSDSRCKYCIFGIMTSAISFNLCREILYVLRKILTPFCASFPPSWSALNRNGLCSMYYMFTCFWYFFRLFVYVLTRENVFHIGIVTLHFCVTLWHDRSWTRSRAIFRQHGWYRKLS